jgi:hypothetical protein
VLLKLTKKLSQKTENLKKSWRRPTYRFKTSKKVRRNFCRNKPNRCKNKENYSAYRNKKLKNKNMMISF